ncbi:MAG: hypothetical protein NZ553_07605 [Caldilinea sp.]|nr:hypothetical protein [Caldilinea sp.]MDW8440321.1 hypothetical protein [Caldilineaceae bacterium]
MISHNGTPPPPATSPRIHQKPTEFLPDAPAELWLTRLYLVERAELLGVPLIRWLYLTLLGLALAWTVLRLPGSWTVGIVLLTSAAALHLTLQHARSRAYTTFIPQQAPTPPAQILAPAQKRPVYVTGVLSVEQKVRAFTALPGFYRTFATREHALLCRVRPRRIWAIAAWPEDEIGLWYAFFTPGQILAIQPGITRIDRRTLPGLAITYRPDGDDARQRQPSSPLTLYLAFVDESDRDAVLADLLVDWRPVNAAEEQK